MNIPFYIALRYLIAKKGSQAVTFITGLAVIAMSIAVMALFIAISAFSGLEELNKELISNLHSDLTIKSKGKQIPDLEKITFILKKEPEIKAFSKVIEEKVYLNYNNNGEIAYIRGVDSLYLQINPTLGQTTKRTQHGAGELTCCVAGFGHAQAAAGAWLSRATATRAAKAFESVTARSARILRSTSTPAFFRPLMRRL